MQRLREILSITALVSLACANVSPARAQDCNHNDINDDAELVGGLQFQRPLTVPVDVGSEYLAHINEDRSPDILGRYGTGGLVVARNLGDWAFEKPIQYGCEGCEDSYALGMAAGDWDGDGDIDAILALEKYGRVQVFLNNGDGTFSLGKSCPAGASPHQMVQGDFDADGDLDLAVSNCPFNGDGEGVTLLWNNGIGEFTKGKTHRFQQEGGYIYDIIASDWNQDGDTDFALVRYFGGNRIYIYDNDGTGSFANSATIKLPGFSSALCTADFDNDGFPDLAGAGHASVVICLNPGLEDRWEIAELNLTAQAEDVEAWDYDADGDPDLAVCELQADGSDSWAPSATSLFANDGAGRFRGAVRLSRHGARFLVPAAEELHDLDDDGNADLAIWETTSVAILGGDSSGPPIGEIGYLAGEGSIAVAVGQLNGDGLVDFAAANETIRTITTYVANEFGGLDSLATIELDETPVDLKIGDLDDDGAGDIVVTHNYSGLLVVAMRRGEGFSLSSYQVSMSSIYPRCQLADVTGDGAPDVLVAGGMEFVSLFENDGHGSLSSEVRVGKGMRASDVEAVDLDGDEDTDLAVADLANGAVSILLNDGKGGFAATNRVDIDRSPVRITAGDFDDDGDMDLATINDEYGNSPDWVTVLLNVGNATFWESEFEFDQKLAEIDGGDLDGDGDADLVTVSQDYRVTFLESGRSGKFESLWPVNLEDYYPRDVVVIDDEVGGPARVALADFWKGAIRIAPVASIDRKEDCNQNDRPDECDISDGIVFDDNQNGIPDSCEVVYGDLNCDGRINFDDIDGFVLALINPEEFQQVYPACIWLAGDIDRNGSVDFDDIDHFVDCIKNHRCD